MKNCCENLLPSHCHLKRFLKVFSFFDGNDEPFGYDFCGLTEYKKDIFKVLLRESPTMLEKWW